MKHYYEIDEGLYNLALEVLEEREDLKPLAESGARICFLTSTEYKKTKRKIVFADTRIVKGVWTAFVPYDFIITFYIRHITQLDNEQLKILMWHELKHCGVTSGEQFYIEPHDIEDFNKIIEEYGHRWADQRQVGGEAELD